MNLWVTTAIIIGLFFSGACSEQSTVSGSGNEEASQANSPEQRTLPELYKHFESSGIVIEAKEPKHGGIIGATAGKSLKIGDGHVEVYQYNLSIESGVEALARLKKRGVMGRAALVNNNLVLLDTPDHPQWKNIETVFLGMK